MIKRFDIFAAFTLLALLSAVQGRRYIGCFNKNDYYELVSTQGTFTVDNCAEVCLSRQKVFAIIRNVECRCAMNIITSRVDLSLCNIDCGQEKCGGSNVASIYLATVPLIESDEEKTKSTANFPSFEGCFGDLNMVFEQFAQSWDKQNSNLRCAQHCRRNGYIISATKETFCGCSNTLPSILYSSADDLDKATGENSQCNTRCGGMAQSTDKCQLDECCGGSTAYSIYTTGEINAVRQLLVNAVSALNRNQQILLKKLTQLTQSNFFATSGTDFVNDFDSPLDYSCPNDAPIVGLYSVHDNSKEDRRFKIRCGQTNNLQAYGCAWTDYINNFDAEFYYQCPTGKYIAGLNSYHENSYEDRRWKIKCCFSQRIPTTTTCSWTGYINSYDNVMDFWSSPQGNSFIQGFGGVNSNSYNDRMFKTCTAPVSADSSLIFNVTLRAQLNSYTNGGSTDNCNNICVLLSTDSDHTCRPVTSLGLHYAKINVKNMKRLLVHGTPTSIEPLGEYDTEYDNSYSTKENTLTKTFQVTKTTDTSFSTSAGINMGIDFGTKIGTKANIFGQEFSLELSASASLKTSLTVGYSKTSSSSTAESFSTQVTVPAGKKVLLNLFKEKYDLSVKWRANLQAIGFVEIGMDGKSVRVDIGEVLAEYERDLYAYGTLMFGDRQKITAVTSFFDFGVVSKPRLPPQPSITFNKTSSENDITQKYGLTP